jgi:hypothetical protein
MLFMIRKFFVVISGLIYVNNLNNFNIRLKILLLVYIKNFNLSQKIKRQALINLLINMLKEQRIMLINNLEQ